MAEPPRCDSRRGRRSLSGLAMSGPVGFGLIVAAYALEPQLGPEAYLLGLPGFLALGGCPTCWVKSVVATLSAGRLERKCADGVCALAARTDGRTNSSASGWKGPSSSLGRRAPLKPSNRPPLAQLSSSRGSAISSWSSVRAAAMGIATRAPTMPRSAPPSTVATTVASPGTETVLRMIRGVSR